MIHDLPAGQTQHAQSTTQELVAELRNTIGSANFRASQRAADKIEQLERELFAANESTNKWYVQAMTQSSEAEKKLAAAQLQNTRLRDYLHDIGNIAHDKSTGPAIEDGYWEIQEFANEALNLTADTSSLNAKLEVVREQAAAIAWRYFMDACKKREVSPTLMDGWCAADEIRNMKIGE